jgi:hypothetical protein
MSSQLPVAVINGIEKFGAKQLASLLIQNDIRVVGVGEFVVGWGEMKNFEYVDKLDEVEEKVDYWFDFGEDENVWKRAEADKSRLTIVGVNRSAGVSSTLTGLAANWRIINVHGVYGEGMGGGGGRTGEVEYLIKAIRLAVANRNLILPQRSARLRLVAVDDFKEVVLRSSFLSGTEGQVFEIWGRAVTTEELAKTLIEEGKMTRFKVEEEETELDLPSDKKVMEDWRKLKWQPAVELAAGMKETMQYFFSAADEENRKKKTGMAAIKKEIPAPLPHLKEEVEKKSEEREQVNKKRYEVMVEKEAAAGEEEEKSVVKAEVVKEEEPEVVEEESFEEIKPIIVKKEETAAAEVKTEPIKAENKRSGFSLGKYGKWVIGGVVMAVVLWGLFGLWENYRMWTGAKTIENLILAGKYPEATRTINGYLVLAKKEDDGIENWGINKWVWGRRYQTALKILEEGLTVGNQAVDVSQKAEDINGAIFDGKTIDWGSELAGLKLDLAESNDDLGVLQARLSGDWSWVPDRWQGELTSMRQQLGAASGMVALGERAVDLLPEILGTDGGKRDFMVLLQNESELRASGGFIGSWAILSFEGGKLTNFDIQDIYQADGQLKGHVEPPLPIKNFLGEASWYMRDANYQADFPSAAKDIQWFLNKETGRTVDGVIGVDLAVARAILGVTGEVYVPDFKENITKDNIYEQAEFYAETNSFPGSTQKASFLGSLGKQLFGQIQSLSPEKKLELARAVLEMLQENEIQLALNDKTAARVAADLSWDGAMYDGKCTQNNCFADYLYVVESNFGVNKANYFLNRNMDLEVDISPTAVGRVLKINYQNTAKNNTWPGGDYKDYLRIYIPQTTNLAEVSITDNNGVKTVVSGSDLSIALVGDRKEIGFLATVPVGEKRTVEVSYSDQIDLSKATSFSYLDYVQKQPGFGETPLVSLVSMPDGWQPTGVEPTASMVNGKLLFNLILDQDTKLGVELGK